jgi:dihydrofolate reductase
MRKLVVSTFLTLDGVMQAPGGSDEDTEGGFEHGGWQLVYFDEIFGKTIMDGFAATDALLLGRKTYDIFAAFWPNQPDDDPIAPTMNAFDKYVVTRTLDEAEWVNSKVIKGDVVAEIKKLKEQAGKDIRVIGSGDLAQTLMANDLVDEYQLVIHPLVFGTGKRLFRDGTKPTKLRLVDRTTTTKGVAILTYVPDRS